MHAFVHVCDACAVQEIQGLLDHVMRGLAVPWNASKNPEAPGYYLQASAGMCI